MISHDINIASKYSDNIIMMHDGGIYALGRPKDVITADNISKVYQVGAKIIDDGGKPHLILVDDDHTNYDDDHEFSVIATKSGETYKGP
jgi:iron complex transport system ATP-binding protein